MSHTEPKDLRSTLTLSLAALGIVFGDIGTSILYAFQESFHGAHPIPVTNENVMGITSLILWSLILVVTVKYVWVLMNADNKGEGGILILQSMVPLPLRFNSAGFLAGASLLGIAGASLLFGDGIITPAISVLSAVEGLTLVSPHFEEWVMPVTMLILLGLFLIQSRGTGSLGKYFGSVVLLWFVVAAVLGIRHISDNLGVFRAFYPKYAFHFFENEGWHGTRVLGSVILAVTGGEALYADMGHFGRKPIRVAWHWVALPALMLNYLGQAALIIAHPEASHRPFFSMIEPSGPLFYGLVLLATLATIIASQALITGAFSLAYQSMRLGIFPRMKVVHTSEDLQGRVYVPFVNTLLAVSCLSIVLFFQKSSRLASAYGLAVAGTMTLTTLLFYYVAHYRWRWSLWKTLPMIAPLLFIDVAFLYSNLIKIPDGGWVPLVIGMGFFFCMRFWQHGRAQLSRFFRERSKTMNEFFDEIENRETRRINGTLVVLASTENRTPPVLGRLVDTMHVIQEHVILVTVITADDPFVSETERVRTTDLKLGVSRVVMKFGYMESPDIPLVLSACRFSHLPTFPTKEAIYLLGRETLLITGDTWFERGRQHLFSLLSRNSGSASDYFNLPANQVLELGAQLSV